MLVDLSLISKYRTELMGIGTLLIILCHMPASVPEMPARLGYFLSIGNIGVDFFLFLSGLGLHYSLINRKLLQRSIKEWYAHRFRRLFVPYFLISVPFVILNDWGLGVVNMLMDLSTISFWTSHRSAWFIALLIPLYLIAPFVWDKCQPIWKGLVICVSLAYLSLFLGHLSYQQQGFIYNLDFALMRVPSFILGLSFAPLVKAGQKKSITWFEGIFFCFFIISVIGLCKYFCHDLFMMWLAVPLLLYVSCLVIQRLPRWMNYVLKWGGVLSLESYLLNVYSASSLKGYYFEFSNYLKYLIMVIVDIAVAMLVWYLSQSIIKKSNHINNAGGSISH